MRVKDFIKLYYGMARIEVEIYAIVTVFNEKYRVLVRNFADKLRIFIRGCE